MSHIDSLEPYYLVTSLTLAVPSFALSCYVYYRVMSNTDYRKSRYLRLYISKAINEAIMFVLNLALLHLPIQNYLHLFFNQYTHSLIIPISGAILTATMTSTFLFGVFLSLNRYLAMAQASLFRKYNDNFVLLSLALIYPLPILFGSRALIWSSFLKEFDGKAGPIFLYFTPDMNGYTDIYQYTLTVFRLLCCAAELALNGATFIAIWKKKLFDRSAKRHAEIGLFITTLCSCSLSVMFSGCQVCIQFFTYTAASTVAKRAQLIVVDLMALSSVYFLLAFSSSLRKNVFRVRRSARIFTKIHPQASSQQAFE